MRENEACIGESEWNSNQGFVPIRNRTTIASVLHCCSSAAGQKRNCALDLLARAPFPLLVRASKIVRARTGQLMHPGPFLANERRTYR